jgi:YihY family inner membrane protein
MADERLATAATSTPTSPAPQAGKEAVAMDLAAAPARPVAAGGTWEQVKALGLYMTKTEVHTYAFSVAAQVILSLFPFIVMLLTISKKVFDSDKMVEVVTELMTNFLPNNQDFVMRNMRLLVTVHTQTKIISLVMLFITVTGVFLPLEVALNSVWGVKNNRNYLHNQLVSIGLGVGVASLAMISVALSASQRTLLGWVFFGHTDNIVFTLVGKFFLQIFAFIASIGLFFLIYWGLPNRKIPARAVLPTAVVMGILWTAAKHLYILALPYLDFKSVYGPFEVSVGLMMWAFLSGLLLLAGAYVSATRQALREATDADLAEQAKAS